MQKKKGISLIVLVITIIVMIVLAGAIILSLNNSGIIGKANEAVKSTDEATLKELAQLGWAEAYADGARTAEELKVGVEKALEDNNLKPEDYLLNVTTKGVTAKLLTNAWIKDGLTVKKGKDTLIIGQSVTYDEGAVYDGGWKVLGADADGNLLIMSDADVANVKLGDSTVAKAHTSWLNGTSTITEAVQTAIPLATANNAVSVRSIEAEDIDKVTGYDKTAYGKRTIYEYGNEIIYTYNGTGYPTYTGSNGATGNLTRDHSSKGFYWSDGKTLHYVEASDLTNAENNGKEIAKLTSDYYGYEGASQISADTDAYKMLFGTSDSYLTYWLANSILCVFTGNEFGNFFGMSRVYNGSVNNSLVFSTDGYLRSTNLGTRAVITLSSDINVADLTL